MRRAFTSDQVRNFIFGVEDSLVSTVGLVSGIAVVGSERSVIILTGIVLIFVEAFSMSVGSLLSDNSAREFEKRSSVSLGTSVTSALIMFLSYFLTGFIVITPYFILSGQSAVIVSVAVSILSLFILGAISGFLSRTSRVKKGITMMIIGGLAICIGIVVGLFVERL